ncbi:MAG: hypothetical protein ACM3SW_15510 [Actinomycetota bacterium]
MAGVPDFQHAGIFVFIHSMALPGLEITAAACKTIFLTHPLIFQSPLLQLEMKINAVESAAHAAFTALGILREFSSRRLYDACC